MISETQNKCGKIHIRADADTRNGTGHIMRCIALAQAWQDQGGDVTFLSHCETEALRKRIIDEGFNFISIEKPHPHPDDLIFTLKALSAISHQPSAASSWFVLDGYHFTSDYQCQIKEAGYRLLVIDDIAHLDYYHADILLNQNSNASRLSYSCDRDTVKLLGCEYVLLRREFTKYNDWKREISDKAKKILVSMGGADPDNVTLKVVKALNSLNDSDLKVKIVVGPATPNIGSLERESNLSPFAIHFLSSVSNMPELMAWADIAVSAGGSTCWELAFMGLPYMVLVLAENQKYVTEKLEEDGATINLGWYEVVASDMIAKALKKVAHEKKVRSRMSRCGKKLVDGIGGKRVLKSMMVGKVTLRPVQEQDCKLIWKWANDPDMRAGSFSSKFIPWDDHVRWFNSKLNDSHCFFYIAINERAIPIGYVRIDESETEAIISNMIDGEFRGNNYGSMAQKVASEEFFNVSDAQAIHSYVKEDNEASIKMCVNAGFRKLEVTVINGFPVMHLIKDRNKSS